MSCGERRIIPSCESITHTWVLTTKNGNKAKEQPLGTKPEKNFKSCVNRPFIIRAYMDSLDMDKLLLTNQLKFSINIVKIIIKTKGI